MENFWIIAQAGQNQGSSEVSAEPVGQGGQAQAIVDANAPVKGTQAYPKSLLTQLLFIVPFILIIYFLFREPRRKQKQQQKMAQSLKKNDKVRTIGGIIGTVIEVRGDEVLLKVDENNNTKIWFVTSAIGKNMSGEGQ